MRSQDDCCHSKLNTLFPSALPFSQTSSPGLARIKFCLLEFKLIRTALKTLAAKSSRYQAIFSPPMQLGNKAIAS